MNGSDFLCGFQLVSGRSFFQYDKTLQFSGFGCSAYQNFSLPLDLSTC